MKAIHPGRILRRELESQTAYELAVAEEALGNRIAEEVKPVAA